MTAIASELKYHMQRHELSARELARQSGVKSSFIYDVLSGKSPNPSTIKLAQVAKVLGINLSQLVEPNVLNSVPDISIVSSQPFDEMYTPKLLNPVHADTDLHAPFSFSQRWLKQLIKQPSQVHQMSALIVTGDAISPSLQSGDYVLVDMLYQQRTALRSIKCLMQLFERFVCV